MKTSFYKKIFSLALVVFLTGLLMPQLSAQESYSDVINMVTGDIQTVPVNGLTRVSMTNPDVADIADAQSDKVSILGKKAGKTVLFLWDATGKRNVKIRVTSEDLTAVKERVQKILDESSITGVTLEENEDEGKVAVEGTLSKDDKTRLDDILEPYSENLLNLVKEEKNDQLIQVDMQVVEINTTLEQDLGIQWLNSNGTSAVSTTGAASSATLAAASTGLSLPYDERPPSTNGKIGDFFKIGSFNRNFQLQATVNALLQEGKAKLISKPRLVVVSGKQASFLVGGEIPQQNSTTSTSGNAISSSTTYTQYGVNMTVTPTIKNGKIDVILNVDIRDVDNSSSFKGTTGSTVAFITRTASTDLLMDNRQTIALAGLIKYSASETLTEVPFLSKIPLLGALFRDRSIPGDSNTEMVIVLTPTVLTDKKIEDKQIAMPTPEIKESYKQFDAKYEHEPLPAWPVPKASPAPVKENSGLGPTIEYARMVQLRISRAISYPQAAMGKSSGTVKLKLHILKNGSLESEDVIDSSGNDILDQDALRAARSAAPFDAFTTGIDQDDMVFTIPIVYNKLIHATAPAEKVLGSR